MAKGMANEVKTGLWIVTCLAILGVLTFAVGNFTGIEKTYELKAVFNWVSGLEANAPVRLRGVTVGVVKEVDINYDGDDTNIMLTLVVKERAKVRKGTKAYVSMLGLMGEKYVELTDGPQGAPFLEPGAIIEGQDPTSTEELIDVGKKVAEEIELTLIEIRTLTEHLDNMVVENREDIDVIIDRLKGTAANFEEFSSDIKQNPWKLLIKGKKKTEDKATTSKKSRRSSRRR